MELHDQAHFNSLQEFIEPAMQRLKVPGVAVGVYHRGQLFTAGFGVTNLENPLPVDPDTLFQIGSISKTVTATALMRLVERGQVALDTPLRTYLPDLRLADPEVTGKATLRHVFTHTGGWVGDYFDDAGMGDEALAIVVGRMHALAQETPLGAVWSYNNAGFYIAGRVLEVLTGQTFEEAVRELVLDPLGMKHSFYFARDAITYRVSAGHDAVFPGEERSAQVLRPWWLARASNPLGGLVCSLQDLLRYARFHLGDGCTPTGERLLSADSLALMQTPIVPAANGEWMGISWFLRDVDGARIARHGGATNGQMAMLQIIPEKEFAFAALTNSDRGSELYQPLAKMTLERFLGLVEEEPQPLQTPETELIQFCGQFSAAAQDLHLNLRDGSLFLQVEPKGGFPTPDSPPSPAPPPVRMTLCEADVLVGLDEPFKGNRAECLRNEQGELVWIRFGGRVHRKA